ncbi:toll/interleukin-1 receptor domain-containing protein [Streptomyces sp. NBC_00433]
MRRTEQAPSGAEIGSITLRAWQIDAVEPVPESHSGLSAYLVRIVYDLDIEPDAPGPDWFEIGFTFADDVTTVHDAIPQHIDRLDEARIYALDSRLLFTPQERGATGLVSDIQLPAVRPEIQVFGLNGSTLRWRHLGTAGSTVRAGSRTGWMLLLVPPDRRKVPVLATARFSLPSEERDGLHEASWPDVFTITLPDRQTAAPRTVVHRVAVGCPRAFVSYAWDDDAHQAMVLALCELLEAQGIDVTVDQKQSPVRRDWNEWMTTGVMRSDYVLVIASSVYRAAGLYELDERTHTGVQCEYRLLMEGMHDNRIRWTRKILPIVLQGRTVAEIPVGLQPHDADHFLVPSLTEDGIKGLVRTIRAGHGE